MTYVVVLIFSCGSSIVFLGRKFQKFQWLFSNFRIRPANRAALAVYQLILTYPFKMLKLKQLNLKLILQCVRASSWPLQTSTNQTSNSFSFQHFSKTFSLHSFLNLFLYFTLVVVRHSQQLKTQSTTNSSTTLTTLTMFSGGVFSPLGSMLLVSGVAWVDAAADCSANRNKLCRPCTRDSPGIAYSTAW